MQGPFPAKVINNNDTKKKGRIQIKIEHLHYNIKNSELPWAKQYSLATGGSGTYGKSSIPENNSYVWIGYEDVDELMRQPYYLADIHFSNLHPHNLFENNIKSSIGSAAAYPNAKYTYYPNGICIGVDSSSGNKEIFIYHPTASIFIDKNGKIKIKATEIELLGGTTPSESSILGETLKTTLEAILDQIIAHTHPYINVAAPAVTSPPGNAAAFTLIKTTQVPTTLSLKIKNN